MSFKTTSLIAVLIISMFILSSCEVYQTLYGSGANATGQVMPPTTEKVYRVEGAEAKDPKILSKTAYAAAAKVDHDPFKLGKNPLGPYDAGKSLEFTLGDWLAASGSGTYSINDGKAKIKVSFQKLVPNGIYTVWCSRLTFPPNFNVVDRPCGASDGSKNSFKADAEGSADFKLDLKPLEESTKETTSLIAIAYHSDGKTHGESAGDFGLNSHVQLFFPVPVPETSNTSFEIPIKMVSHLDANLPEQDVFVEQEPQMEKKAEEQKPAEAPQQQEVMEQKPKEKPFVVVVQETDLVSLTPKAEDPDKESVLTYTFTSPVDDKGEWQTKYGDAGEYTVTVTVSDGESTSSRDVLIIVNKKEEAPTIDVSKPIESALVIDETQSVDFTITASDLNKDPLAYTWKLDGIEVGTDNKYTYQTDYDSAGTHTVKVEVSDGTSSQSKIWSVDVKNVNRKPVLEHIDDIKVKETNKVVLTALATDDDKDTITYSISDKRFKQEGNVFTWETDYDSAGSYDVTVSATDGTDTTSQKLKVEVENLNRLPVIVDISQKH